MSAETSPGLIFRRIHRVLTAIHLCNEGLEKIPKQQKTLQNRLIGAEKVKADGLETIKKAKVEQHQAEVSLKQLTALKDKYLKQQDEASDPKVFEALTHELATTEKKIGETEDMILNLMTKIDETTAKLPEWDKGIAKAKEELAGFDKVAAEKKSDLESQLAVHKSKLELLETEIPSDHTAWYLRGKKATFHDGLAAVEGKSCSACMTHITTQMLNEVQNHRFVTCKSCGRILYEAGPD